MPRPLFVQRKNLLYSLDRRLGGPQRQSGCGGEDVKIPSFPLPGIETSSSR